MKSLQGKVTILIGALPPLLLAVLGSLLGMGARPLAPVVASSTYMVTSTIDAPDADQGDGICAAAGGACTLRAAIMQANFTTEPNTITVPAGVYMLTRPGDDDAAVLGDLDIADDLTIQGAGAGVTIVDGNGAVTGDRVFQILSSAKETSLSGLTIRNGKKLANTFDEGGGLYWEGGGGHLRLSDVIIEGNAARYAGGLSARFSSAGGSIELNNITVRANTASAAGGGLVADFSGTFSDFVMRNSQMYSNTAYEGGGIALQGVPSFGHMRIEDSEIYSNTASLSAAIDNRSGDAANPLAVLDSHLHNNHAAYEGGAIANFATLVISGTTLDANTAGMYGGGIYNYYGGLVNIAQSTLSGNSAQYGGGIYSDAFVYNRTLVALTNSTLSGNIASRDGAGLYANGGQAQLFNATIDGNRVVVPFMTFYAGMGGGLYITATATITMQNTLLADNTHRYGIDLPAPDDCFGPLHSLGFNLIETTANCTISGTTVGNVTGQDPLLGSLQNNGGATPTRALLPSSPAIDAGNPVGCKGDNGNLTTDQRGVARPYNGRCDIGAYEAAAHVSQSITFEPIPNTILTDSPFVITATASSGLTVNFSTNTPTICNVSASTLYGGVSSATVTLSKVGNCALVAQQPGNPTFDPAPAVTQTFNVRVKVFLPLVVR